MDFSSAKYRSATQTIIQHKLSLGFDLLILLAYSLFKEMAIE